MVELNGYRYEILGSWDANGVPCEPTDEMQAAKDLDEFLSDVEEWDDEKLSALQKRVLSEGLTEDICSRLYECYYDVCYIGDMKEKEFLNLFNITKSQLGSILM